MRRRLSRLAIAGAILLTPVAPSPANAAASSPTNSSISWIAVSPAYATTGLLAVMGGSCGNRSCLWVSHDGAGTWVKARASGWLGGRIFIGVDSRGHERFYAESSSSVQQSDDAGETWKKAGGGGSPTISPRYPRSGEVAVAGMKSPDYVLRNGSSQTVSGSEGEGLADLSFMLAPDYPSGGSFSPAVLAAADKSQGLPVIQRCDADLSCRGSTKLAGSSTYSAPGMQLFAAGDYGRSGVVFARTGRGLYKSVDGGSNFVPLTVGQLGATGTATPMFALAPGYREEGPIRTAYVAVLQIFSTGSSSRSGGGIYRTTDGGKTWGALGSPGRFDGGATAFGIAPDSSRLFGSYVAAPGGGGAGLLCSDDGGKTWTSPCRKTRETGGAASTDPGGAPCTGACPSTGGTSQRKTDSSTDPGSTGQRAQGSADSGSRKAGAAVRVVLPTVLPLALIAGGLAVWRGRRRRPG